MFKSKKVLKTKLVALVSTLLLSTSVAAEEQKTEDRIDESERVSVTWINPKKFTDIKATNEVRTRFRNRTMKKLHKYMDELAQDLPEGQMLKFNVTDLDLAGRVWPGHFVGFDSASDVRIVKQIEIPRMNFSYELVDATGFVVKSGEKNLKDMAFLDRINGIRRSDSLRHEKTMIKRWFKKEFKEELNASTL